MKTYKNAGVDVDLGDVLVQEIKQLNTPGPNVLAGIGGFGALYQLAKYNNPVLVSGTDGVGTKLKLAFELNQHETIGIDLVAMCVNDIITCGASPLFFLDYFATSKLQLDVAKSVIKGIVEGCKLAECDLVGGETAELPGFYSTGEYDLAGFAVGVVEKENIIDGTKIYPDQKIIALASSGLHSNGFSLARQVLDSSFYSKLLTPTRIYAKAVKKLLKIEDEIITGMAHITGGGLVGNIPRIFPQNKAAKLDLNTYERPDIFKSISGKGPVSEDEMRKVFNLGIGYILVVKSHAAEHLVRFLNNYEEKAWIVGEVVEADANEVIFKE